MKFFSILLMFFVSFSLIATDEVNEHPLVLASYPRSGNTWMRYCLEYLTKRPSFKNGSYSQLLNRLPAYWNSDFYSQKGIADNPLGLTIKSLKIDLEKPAIVKCHYFDHSLSSEVPIIFLLRDYMECIVRENKYYFSPKEALEREIEKGKPPMRPGHYFSILRQFDLYTGPKLLIYYEDLMLCPKESLALVLEFLNEDDFYLESFLNNFDFHKKQSLKIYDNLGSSDTKGNKPNFHKEKLSEEDRISIEAAVIETYPDLWEKYLLRYKQPCY